MSARSGSLVAWASARHWPVRQRVVQEPADDVLPTIRIAEPGGAELAPSHAPVLGDLRDDEHHPYNTM